MLTSPLGTTEGKISTRRTDHRPLLDDLAHFREDLYGLAHVTGWEPHDLHCLAHVSWVGCVLHVYRDPAQHLLTANTGSTVDCKCYIRYLDRDLLKWRLQHRSHGAASVTEVVGVSELPNARSCVTSVRHGDVRTTARSYQALD